MAAAATAAAAAAATAGHTEKHQNTFISCWPKSNRVVAGEGPMALADTALLHASVASWKWGTPIVIWPERWSPWGVARPGLTRIGTEPMQVPRSISQMLSETRTPLRLYTSTRSKRCPSKSASSATPIGWAGIAEGVARNIVNWTRALPASRVLHPCPGRPGRCAGLFLIHAYGEPSLWQGNRGVTPGAK